ncbi:NAD(P)-dependent oxidoreductase [Halomicroarcula sp. GCM10025709]|uniref:NAD(P)-dependent oxidoreductase n=1 Tax=Halomicroarcula sp. GCM10025709 TaxID=3252669 RepID=UPI00361C99F7
MRLTVFGASGRTGRPLVEQALDRGHEVVAFVRSAPKFGVEADALTVVEGDAYTGEGVEEAVIGADAVVSVLGQTGDGPDDLLTVAGDHIVEAMTDAGVTRFVTLVGAGVREEGESVTLSGRVMGTLLKVLARSVLEDAEEHVRRVRSTDLDYTVVRAPGWSTAREPATTGPATSTWGSSPSRGQTWLGSCSTASRTSATSARCRR